MGIDEAIDLYKNASVEELRNIANGICEEIYGNRIFLRGLVEFSNNCDRDCLYCGIRKSNSAVNRYRLSDEEIIDACLKGFSLGLRTFVLQSGESGDYPASRLCGIAEKIKESTRGEAALTCSCGIFTRDDYRAMRQSGVDRYLIRFETSDPVLHENLRNGISLERRLKAIEDLKCLGFEVGSGYMTGLPGETEEIRINNALLCRSLELDMIGIGPFIPHHDTPLGGSERHGIEHTLKAVALVRLLLPYSNIPATTATGSLDQYGREKALMSGANVLMPNITPVQHKRDYLLYPDKICIDENGIDCIGCLNVRLKIIDKEISLERGDSKSRENKQGEKKRA